jgi:predicted site-specific integrase-resolvase
VDETLLTMAQVAERYSVTILTVRRWCRAGHRGPNRAKKAQLVSIKVGGSVRIREADLIAWIEENSKR